MAKKKLFTILIIILVCAFAVPFLIPQQEQIEPEFTVNVTCSDSDEESIPTIRGVCSDLDDHVDYCQSESMLVEFSCRDNRCRSMLINCSTLNMECLDGACQPANNSEEPEEKKQIGMPDLRLKSVNHYVQNTSLYNSTPNGSVYIGYNLSLFVDVSIENIGDWPAYTSKSKIDLSGTKSESHMIDTPVVYNNEIIVIKTNFSLPSGSGSYVINATADIHNKLNESDESNNKKIVSFSVT